MAFNFSSNHINNDNTVNDIIINNKSLKVTKGNGKYVEIDLSHLLNQDIIGIESNDLFDFYLTVCPNSKPKLTIKTEENIFPLLKFSFKDYFSITSNQMYTTTLKHKAILTIPSLTYIHKSGIGDIIGNINCPKLSVKLLGNGNINLSGNTEDLEVDLSGNGNIYLESLIAKNVFAKLSGIGNISVTAIKSFNGKLFGIGDITIDGNPGVFNAIQNGIGKYIKKNTDNLANKIELPSNAQHDHKDIDSNNIELDIETKPKMTLKEKFKNFI
jgi:hypothetical protein